MKSIIAVLFATVTLITSPSLFASGCSGSDHDHGDSYDKDHASVETDNERGGGNYQLIRENLLRNRGRHRGPRFTIFTSSTSNTAEKATNETGGRYPCQPAGVSHPVSPMTNTCPPEINRLTYPNRWPRFHRSTPTASIINGSDVIAVTDRHHKLRIPNNMLSSPVRFNRPVISKNLGQYSGENSNNAMSAWIAAIENPISPQNLTRINCFGGSLE